MENEQIELTIKNILEEQAPKIKETLIVALKQKVVDNFNYGFSDEVDKAVREFVKTELGPEIKIIMSDSKEVILGAFREALIKACASLIPVIEKTVSENLTGYRGKELISKLLS